jgi:chromosomal replication initiator protein
MDAAGDDNDDIFIDLARENTGDGRNAARSPLAPPGAAEAPAPHAVERPSNINPKYTFDSFVTGPTNRFAQAAALSVAETPARAYNPLFVYGDAGLGKTHLLQAIAHYVTEIYPTYRVRYISTETLLNEFIDAIRNNAQPEFKRRYREIDVLLVDDVQFMEGKEQLQEEFFHTFNTLHEANRQIVLSSDRPPDAVATLEDRLRSRFKWGLVTDILPPDFETRLAILRKKAAHSNVRISSAVLEFIVTHITNNIRELEGALNRVTAYAALNRVEVSVEDCERILGDIISDRQPRQITPQLILDATAEKYGFTVEELKAKDRRRPLVTARQVSMYLFRELTDLSYPQIAKQFGGRDHTTVIHAYDKISALMQERQAIYDDVQELIKIVKAA